MDPLYINYNYLDDKNVQSRVQPMVRVALDRYGLYQYLPIKYNYIMAQNTPQGVIWTIIVYVMNKNIISWNPIQQRLIIKVLEYRDGRDVKVISVTYDHNSIDNNLLIPYPSSNYIDNPLWIPYAFSPSYRYYRRRHGAYDGSLRRQGNWGRGRRGIRRGGARRIRR